MKANYHFKDHVADIAVTAEAETLEELFTMFANAYREVVIEGGCSKEKDRKTIVITADEIDELLVDFLSELNYLTLVKKWIFCDIKDIEITESEDEELKVTAVIEGEPFDPERVAMKTEIKAVTYHQLQIKKTEMGFTADLIFDI